MVLKCRKDGDALDPNEYKKLLERVDKFGKGLSEWEISFVAGLIDNPPRVPSQKQIDILKRIDKQKVRSCSR